MARITIIKPAGFTGSIGATRFDKGEGETEQPTAVAYFRRHPDRFEVHEDEPSEPEGWAALTDEELLEAYTTNVDADQGPGDRESLVAALEAIDAEADTFTDEPAEDAEPEGETEPDPEDAGSPLTEPEDDGAEAAGVDPYDLSVEALRKLASHRGIAVRGSKAELQDRLREHDQED